MRIPVPLLLGLVFLLGLPIASQGESPAERELRSVMDLEPHPSHGRRLFDTCAACHGQAGAGVSDGTVPAIAAQPFRVVVWELVSFRHANRRDPRMEHFTDEHHLSTAQDVADVAAYASHLGPTRSPVHGDGTHVTPGAEIYARECSSCHGAKAEGNGPKQYPRLAGQQFEYLLRQLREAAENRRPDLTRDHVHLIEHLDPSDLSGLCDFLSRLGP